VRQRTLGAAAFVAALAVLPRSARAIEHEHQVGADLGASMLAISGKSAPDLGPAAGLHYTYGLTDAFNLVVEGDWSLLALGSQGDSKTPHTRPTWGADADVGVAYVFDVVRWVPYAGLLVGGYVLSGGNIDGAHILPGAALVLGFDYRFNRAWSAGVAVRQHMLTDMGTYPSLTQAFARLEVTWGW
jgi:hypothetical protein